MHPVAYIDLISILACLIAAICLIRGGTRSGFSRSVRVLLALLLGLMTYYRIVLFLEWSNVTTRLDWVEDLGGVAGPPPRVPSGGVADTQPPAGFSVATRCRVEALELGEGHSTGSASLAFRVAGHTDLVRRRWPVQR